MNGPFAISRFLAAVNADKISGADFEGIQEYRSKTQAEIQTLETEYDTACRDYAALIQTRSENAKKLETATVRLYEARIATCSEVNTNPAADINALAMRYLPLQQEVDLLTDSLNLLDHVLLPKALERKLLTVRNLKRARHLEAALLTAASQADTQQKIERTWTSNAGRIAVISEETEVLKLATAESLREAQQSDEALSAERTRQLVSNQTRLANAQITAIEGVYAALGLSRSTTPREDSNA